jgi:hypothetical protein
VWGVDKGARVCRATKAGPPSAVAFSRQADRLAVADLDRRAYLPARAGAT